MQDLNRVTLVGRLTRDPELSALPSGRSVCALRIASNSSHKDADTGEWSDRPNFFDVSVFGGRAETVATYMRRGRAIAIDGKLAWREWETKDEQKRQAVSIVADTIQFLPGSGERSEEGQLVGAAVNGDGDEAPF